MDDSKRIIMKKLFLLLVPTLLSIQSEAYVAGVALFEETHFKGAHTFINTDWNCSNYNIPCIGIKSILIPDGWEIWVYEGANFTGDFLRLTSSWNGVDHQGHTWRDDIRSIRIVRKADSNCKHQAHNLTPVVTVFEHDFEGDSMKLSCNWTIGGQNGFAWNDRISSIHVPEGMIIRVYEHANFQGRYMDINGFWKPHAWDDFWNDRISSIQILR